MVERSEAPAAVEGSQLLIAGQKILPSGRPRFLELSSGVEIVFPLSVEIKGKSTITENHKSSEPLFQPYSLLNIGDSITGKNLWGFSSDLIGKDDITVGGRGRTGAHSGQELKVSGICFMEIIQGWRGLAVGIHPKDKLLK